MSGARVAAQPGTDAPSPPPVPTPPPIPHDARPPMPPTVISTPTSGAAVEQVEPPDRLPVPVPTEPIVPFRHEPPETAPYWMWALGGAAAGSVIALILTFAVIRPSVDRPADVIDTEVAGLVDQTVSVRPGGIEVDQTQLDDARARLGTATVLPRLVADTPYRQAEYRPGGWPDSDGDCQNNRHEALIDEAVEPVELRSDGCAVSAGRWLDPFDGSDHTSIDALVVTHLVPLEEAHRSGADAWTPERRADYAAGAEARSLVVVSTPVQAGKADRRPDQWRPPLRAAWCGYAIDWIDVKTEWGLAFTPGEIAALDGMLDTCRTNP